MITTVIFDLDDTLYDEIDYCESGFTAVSQFISQIPGAPSVEYTFTVLWDQFTAGDRQKIFNSTLDTLKLDYNEERIQKLVDIYRKHIPKITLPTDSRDVLIELKEKYTLALLTDGFLPAQRLKVQALGIETFFRIIVYTEQLGREFWKPSPAGYEKIIQDLNEAPARMVYIGDNEKKDFIAPNTLGISTIQLIRPARLHTSMATETGAEAQYVIHDIRQLPALLESQ